MYNNQFHNPSHTNDLSEKQIVLALIAVFILSAILSRAIYSPCDDAYIFYVYVKNLLAGNGLTYNGTVVWGFTSILWITVLSLAGLLGIPIHVGGELLSTVSGWFALGATYFLGRNFGLTRKYALIPVILLAATGDFIFYSAVGLEQVLFSGLIAVSTAFIVSERYKTNSGMVSTACIISAMILTRPEGFLIAILLLLVMLKKQKSLFSPFICGLLTICFIAPIFIALQFYFGDWLPNTFYAKSNAGLNNSNYGLVYLSDSFQRYSVVIVLGTAILIWTIVKNRFRSQLNEWSLLLITLIWLTYVTAQGEDNMVGGRVLIPILPLAYVALVAFASDFSSKWLFPIIFLISITLFTSYLLDPRVTKHRKMWRVAFDGRYNAGIFLRDNFPPNTLVALNPAGIIPYYSGLPTIDMLGLNDWHIAHKGKRDYQLRFAHQAGDGNYVLSRKPDIILLSGFKQQPGKYISDREIWNSTKFHDEYAPLTWQGIGTAYIRGK